MTDRLHQTYDCIFIWSRGGAGHKAVMDAKKQEWAAKGNYRLLDLDIMGEEFLNCIRIPFVGGFGDFCVNFWNGAQMSGNITQQMVLVRLQWLAEILFYPVIYFKIKKILNRLQEPLRCIIVTQPLCNTAIARAIRHVNLKNNWNMMMEVWMSDLPTEKATHFFSSVKKVARNEKLRPYIVLYAPPPEIREGECDKEWWYQNCGDVKVVTDQPYPIRKAFLEQKSLLGQQVQLFLKTENQYKMAFNIQKQDKVATLMLGSQPSKQAVVDYIDIMIKLARVKSRKNKGKKKSSANYYFFVFCGESSRNDSLRNEIKKRLSSGSFPPILKIIPFNYQTDLELAPLLARSDLTLTRSGGSTAMELMHLNKDKKGITLIHSEAYDAKPSPFKRFHRTLEIKSKLWKFLNKKVSQDSDAAPLFTENEKSMFKGIIRWEVGNAEYLKKKIEAQVVSPTQIEQILQQVFFATENSSCSLN